MLEYYGHNIRESIVSVIEEIDKIAYLVLIVLSQPLPLTFCPIPVPLTRNPFSILRRNLSSVPLTVNGRNPSTPCFRASLTRSACLRSEYFPNAKGAKNF